MGPSSPTKEGCDMSKVIQALEKRHPGSKVVDIHIDGVYDEDEIMVAIVNAGPPMTSPEQMEERYGLPDTIHPDAG